MLENFESDYENLKSSANCQQTKLECVYYQLEEKNRNDQQAGYDRYLEKLDDLKATVSVKRLILRVCLFGSSRSFLFVSNSLTVKIR